MSCITRNRLGQEGDSKIARYAETCVMLFVSRSRRKPVHATRHEHMQQFIVAFAAGAVNQLHASSKHKQSLHARALMRTATHCFAGCSEVKVRKNANDHTFHLWQWNNSKTPRGPQKAKANTQTRTYERQLGWTLLGSAECMLDPRLQLCLQPIIL